MSIDIKELKRLARKVAECEDRPEIADEHAEAADALWLHMHCHTILGLIEEIERRDENPNFRAVQSAHQEAEKLKTDNEAWRLTVEAERLIKRGISDENEALRMQVKELDLLFGRYLLGMRAAVVEWQKGKGADAAMQWIWNGLRGPGELPPEEETQAQAYFDREVVKIEEGLEEVYAYRDKRRAEKDKERGQ
ncbi:hypothetical protein ACNFCI_09935 [Pseudomonas sp. NY15356]|uniref:hypothetical protein n=1 Tax=unclassified Pseudomonas TaxID=196821 RepID=UPI002576FE3A|nr:hypothetical protein [Pseudomonas sp. 165]